MNPEQFSFPRDFKPEARRVGNTWVAIFTLPWKHEHFVRDLKTKEVCRFDTEFEAFTAATAVLCQHFRDKTRGLTNGISHQTAEIEAVFGKQRKKKRTVKIG
jgi:hypothetical protein